VKTITLSYTFYKNSELTAALDSVKRDTGNARPDAARAAP